MKMRKIETVQDVREIGNTIIGKMIKGEVGYFSLVVADSTGYSSCFFTPVSALKGEKGNMIFVQDYEKIMMLLLSHPKISEMEYDENENVVYAVFHNPLAEDYEDLDW